MDGKVLTLKSDFPKASENNVVSFLNRPYMPLVRKRNYQYRTADRNPYILQNNLAHLHTECC